MRISYLLLPTLICMLFGFVALAQPTCEDPIITIEDDIENYAVGDITLQSPNWTSIDIMTAGGQVSQEIVANSGLNAVKIDGSNNPSTIFLTDDLTSGHYILNFSLYIPEGNAPSVNLLENINIAEEIFTSTAELTFSPDEGNLTLFDGSDDQSFSYPNDVWFSCYVFLDFENEIARLNINERHIDSWQLTANNAANQFSGVEFTASGSDTLYIDDVSLREIPAAETGQYCQTAQVLTEPGTYSVPELRCWGGSLDQGGNGSGFLAYWFSFTPSEDGVLTMSSCGGGVDTRGWILSGDCLDLKTVGVNDDQCDIGGGDNWASLREAVVTASTQYFIVWDDAWETDGFDFELSLNTTDPPAEGQFCQSAQDITPGVYFVEEITGNAAVAGPSINNTSGSTTNYAQAQWYQFTPETDGFMSISNCDLAGSDTHFFVYTGDCSSFEGLNQVAQDDNGCDSPLLTSSLDSIAVEGGTTYYIEWMDRWSDELFEWELGFESTVAINTLEADLDLSIFPNPIQKGGNLTIAFNSKIANKGIGLVLYNALGQIVKQTSKEQIGLNQVNLATGDLSPGVYQLQVFVDDQSVSRAVVIQ